jgi:hypothetical protein
MLPSSPTLPKIAGVQLTQLLDYEYRLTLLLWGLAGCGKTTWAQTLPRPILYLNFDDSGHASIQRDAEIIVADFSKEPNTVVKRFQQYGQGAIAELDQFLKTNTNIKSVVLDSITTYQERSVDYAVGDYKAPGATFDNPGRGAYGTRNRNVLGIVKNLLILTGKHGKHFAVTAHEDIPKTDDDGKPTSISMLLGGGTSTELPMKFSEIWLLRDSGKQRRVAVRSSGLYRPMRSRMFDTSSSAEFELKYDPVKSPDSNRIESMYDAWKANNFAKIQLPK